MVATKLETQSERLSIACKGTEKKGYTQIKVHLSTMFLGVGYVYLAGNRMRFLGIKLVKHLFVSTTIFKNCPNMFAPLIAV